MVDNPRRTRARSGATGAGRYADLEHSLRDLVPAIARLLMLHEEAGPQLKLVCRGAGDWLAVATCTGDDGGPQVLFATGFDVTGCLLALDAQVEHGRWRPDTYRSAAGRG